MYARVLHKTHVCNQDLRWHACYDQQGVEKLPDNLVKAFNKVYHPTHQDYVVKGGKLYVDGSGKPCVIGPNSVKPPSMLFKRQMVLQLPRCRKRVSSHIG